MGPSDKLKALKIGFVPGTGRMGSLLARYLAQAGLPNIALGSRDPSKAAYAAQQLSSLPSTSVIVTGASNAEVAAAADIVFWSPLGSLEDREAMLKSLAPQLKDKIIVDITNIGYLIDENQWGQVSSTLLNAKALGVPAKWTTAFKSTYWKLLEDLPDSSNPHNTFVAGDDEEAVETTIALVNCIPGFKGLKAGGLHNSKIVELLGPKWLLELDTLNAGGDSRGGWRFGL